MEKLLVTGSSGWIGSEVVAYFCQLGWEVQGIDNNMRADFFGAAGDTRWNQKWLLARHQNFHHHELDIRHRAAVLDDIFREIHQAVGARWRSTTSAMT